VHQPRGHPPAPLQGLRASPPWARRPFGAHLDTRIIDGQQALLFGPFAGFSTKYLKTGSYFDLIRAIGPGNIWPMLAAGWHNIDLTRYLIGQVLQSPEGPPGRTAQVRAHGATGGLDPGDRRPAVQIIKGDPKLAGKLEFGTEVVAAADGTLARCWGPRPAPPPPPPP